MEPGKYAVGTDTLNITVSLIFEILNFHSVTERIKTLRVFMEAHYRLMLHGRLR
jgi:hypothetical protein